MGHSKFMDWQKIISYVVVGSITGWLFGRHVYRCSINPNRPEDGGDRGSAIMQGIAAGLFWQITIIWAVYKAITDDARNHP